MEVTFEKDGRKLTLASSLDTGLCKMIAGKKLQKMLKNKMTQVARLFSIQAIDEMERSQEQFGELLVTVSSQSQPKWEVHELDSLHMLLLITSQQG